MATIHRTTMVPGKLDLLGDWLPRQPWYRDTGRPVTLTRAGGFRLDDPAGEVGIEGHLATIGDDGVVWHVPLTYRATPLEGAEEHLVGEMEHSVLGTRYTYDAVGDPAYLVAATAVALTGVGQAVEVRQDEQGRWQTRPASVRLTGGPRPGDAGLAAGEWVEVGEYSGPDVQGTSTTLRSGAWELRVERRAQPVQQPSRAYDLTGTWAGQDDPALLVRVTDLATPVPPETGFEG
jgi:hypothetical protein